MPRYLVGGFLAEALHVPESEKVVLSLDRGRVQTAPGKSHPWNGTCVWDEEFSFVLDIAASDFAQQTLQFEVLSLDRGWLGEVGRPLASGLLRLSWIHRSARHFHPRLRLPLKRHAATRSGSRCNGPIELHLAIYVLAAGDAAPEPTWMTSVAMLPWALLTKPTPQKLPVASLPSLAMLEFTMVALWDLNIDDWKALSVDDMLVDLHFLVEARGDVDELVLVEASEVAEAPSKWREMYPAPNGKVCLQLPRTHCFNLELPTSVLWVLRIEVSVKRKDNDEEVLQAEASMPLQRGSWPPAAEPPEDRPPEPLELLPLEDFAPGHFAQVPLFSENSRVAAIEGVDAFAIPGAVGSMKCGYRLSCQPKVCRGTRPSEPLEEDLQSTEEETEVLPELEEQEKSDHPRTAASHTHDCGYRKWETFVQEMEAKPVVRSAPVAIRPQDEDSEDDVQDLLPRVPNVSQLEEAGGHYMLHLYVHDLQLLQVSQGEVELEVLLGANVAFNLSQGRSQSLRRQFRCKKELPIELPRHSRLQLRLKDGPSGGTVGSNVVDLQDRRLVKSLREKEELAECRQLWSQLWCVGSLQMWLRLTPLQVPTAPLRDLWPLPHRMDRVELRVILHEVFFSVATTAKEAVAAIELQMPVERLHRCRLPSSQYSDVRPCHRGLRISFEWRFPFSVKMLLPSLQKCLFINIFDAETWQLLGSTEFLVDAILSEVTESSQRQRINDLPVWTRNQAGVCGSMSLTVRALPRMLAEHFPARSGREPCPVPTVEDRDPRSVVQDLCAERLVCHPPNLTTMKPVLGPKRPPKRRPRWRWVAALAALAALATAALRKEVSHRSTRSYHCPP